MFWKVLPVYQEARWINLDKSLDNTNYTLRVTMPQAAGKNLFFIQLALPTLAMIIKSWQNRQLPQFSQSVVAVCGNTYIVKNGAESCAMSS